MYVRYLIEYRSRARHLAPPVANYRLLHTPRQLASSFCTPTCSQHFFLLNVNDSSTISLRDCPYVLGQPAQSIHCSFAPLPSLSLPVIHSLNHQPNDPPSTPPATPPSAPRRTFPRHPSIGRLRWANSNLPSLDPPGLTHDASNPATKTSTEV
jgi:hypothetical protein